VSDVEKEMEVLQPIGSAKTREIVALVAEQRHSGDVDALDSTDNDRLRIYVEDGDRCQA
jgi:hypothetical protein